MDKCIEKYGEEDGILKHKERQDKWQETLKSKPQEEINEINKKKSNQMSWNLLWKNGSNSDGRLYILELENGFYKIGITTQSIYNRYGNCVYKVILNFESTINHCFQIEQLMKVKFKDNIIHKSEQVEDFGYTETFKDLNLNTLLSEVDILANSTELTTKLFKENFNLKYEDNF